MNFKFGKKNEKGEKNYIVPAMIMIAGAYMVESIFSNICKTVCSVTKTRHGMVEKKEKED